MSETKSFAEELGGALRAPEMEVALAKLAVRVYRAGVVIEAAQRLITHAREEQPRDQYGPGVWRVFPDDAQALEEALDQLLGGSLW